MKRWAIITAILAGSIAASAQSMVETAAAAAGGSAGGIAGKKVSDGLTKIFEKVDKQAAKAAKPPEPSKSKAAPAPAASQSEDSAPLFEVTPGIPATGGVPPPPPVHRASVHRPAPHVEKPVEPVLAPPPPPPPPPPEVTAADLRHVSAGMRRDDVLKLGQPAARITMYDDGHLLEIYRYQHDETSVGTVRLTDGAVSNVVVR